MSIQVFLDGQDITGVLNSQHPLPVSASANGIFPSNKRNDWWDLLPAINANSTLRENFFNNDVGVHTLNIVDSGGETFTVRVLLRAKYSARNR